MPQIKVYSTPSCPYCQLLKQFLEDKGIKFQTIDVSQDKKAQDYIVAKTGKMAVPVTEIGDKIITGFEKEEILKTLGLEEKK